MSNKLELFMQSDNLTMQQAAMLDEMHASINRLSRLNRSLILLTRIENREFSENEAIPLHELLQEQLDQLQEMMQMHDIQVEIEAMQPVFVEMNTGLCEILISNLLLNAIRHNSTGGIIRINLQADELCIKNSGEALQDEPVSLFERFRSGGKFSGSLGIGLALVSKISELYQLQPSYTYEEGLHVLRLNFQKKNRLIPPFFRIASNSRSII
ncbi:sensor histidine kinase KdpD [Pontibacter sp. BAB1700]|uniref:sensor histidine kinase n=1 Tax=Pontibacter sp. BAB1700 TaxID=1144253 RepID=UPI00030E1426|nr:HAMP domain-containing sensor histidine kinase [Pontibacter sp. BAB1700]